MQVICLSFYMLKGSRFVSYVFIIIDEEVSGKIALEVKWLAFSDVISKYSSLFLVVLFYVQIMKVFIYLVEKGVSFGLCGLIVVEVTITCIRDVISKHSVALFHVTIKTSMCVSSLLMKYDN